jgi:HNH endonuclease
MDKEYRKYFGKKFHKQRDGYWANMMPIHAHRWVWINHHGAIPEGMDIHHKDGDKDNNEIENLEMLSRSDHLKRHWEEGRYDLEQRRIQLIEARKWLKTEEGRKKQSNISKKAWETRKTTILKCQECEKEIETTQPWAKFCSNACDKRWRRREKSCMIENICAICNNPFMKDKFSPQRFCSISCGAKNSSKNRKKN